MLTGPAPPLPADELVQRLRGGWRCVRYASCRSFALATVRRWSPVYLTQTPTERVLRGLRPTLGSLLLGPWGVPWGLVWTVSAAWTNLTGGEDVTATVLAEIGAEAGAPA